MKHFLTRAAALLAIVTLAIGCQQQTTAPEAKQASEKTVAQGTQELVVEAACGQCQFELPGDGCDLAVRIEGTAYFVDGTGIDDHGDAHAETGLCNAVRQAKVQGRVEKGRFVAESFELLPGDEE